MSVRGFTAVVFTAAILSTGVKVEADTILVPGDYPTIADAIAAAYPGDRIIAESGAFNNEPTIDWLGKAIRVESQGAITQPNDGIYRLGNGATVAAATGQSLQLNGELSSPIYGGGYVECDELQSNYNGRLVVRAGTSLHISAHSAALSGNVNVERDASLTAAVATGYSFMSNASITLAENADLDVTGKLEIRRLTAMSDASISAGGRIYVDESLIVNNGVVTTSGDFEVTYSSSAILYESELTAAVECRNYSDMQMRNGTILTPYLSNSGALDLLNTTISSEDIYISWNNGEIYGSGMWAADLTNDGDLMITDDTTIIGEVENDGAVTIYNGILTILGALDNNGTIVGSVRGGDKTLGDPKLIRVGDDLSMGNSAQIHLPNADWQLRVDGNCDIAIQNHLAFDLSGARLTLGSLAGANVDYEVMSRDIGPSAAGLDRTYLAHYPIGTLHVAGAVVNLVDDRDNDWLGAEYGEAVYVDTLQIDAGATLNNAGYRIYYNTMINNGYVSDPDNLVEIGAGAPCDLDGDGDVDLSDLAALLGIYGSCQGDVMYNPAADFDLSGCIDLSDLAALLGYYGG